MTPKGHNEKNGYLHPKGYDYSPPEGYTPDKNPTFPNESYLVPKKDHVFP